MERRRTPRSDNAGCEFEGVAIGSYGRRPYLFVGSERCAFVGCTTSATSSSPSFSSSSPRGTGRKDCSRSRGATSFVTANEGDGTLSIFRFARD